MMRFVKALASLKLTLVGMVLLGMASIAIFKLEHNSTPWLAVPLLLLGLNLMAAVATNGVFRRNTPLLVFHLALITIVLLAAAGRLTYLNGAAEVTEGETFNGLKESEAGPLHPWRIDKVQFVNEGMDIDYTPGPVRVSTVSRVRWLDAQGIERRGEARDNTPLVVLGYTSTSRVTRVLRRCCCGSLLRARRCWGPCICRVILPRSMLRLRPGDRVRSKRISGSCWRSRRT